MLDWNQIWQFQSWNCDWFRDHFSWSTVIKEPKYSSNLKRTHLPNVSHSFSQVTVWAINFNSSVRHSTATITPWFKSTPSWTAIKDAKYWTVDRGRSGSITREIRRRFDQVQLQRHQRHLHQGYQNVRCFYIHPDNMHRVEVNKMAVSSLQERRSSWWTNWLNSYNWSMADIHYSTTQPK